MKIALCAVNAKYIHSSLAVRSIKKYCESRGENIDICELTINNSDDFILDEIYSLKPDVIGFSCYIWNMEIIKRTVSSIRKILPRTVIVLGGPEVSYEYDDVIGKYADIISIGEGEKTWVELCGYFRGKRKLYDVHSIAFIENGSIRVNAADTPLELDEIPFVYENADEFKNKIIYYEASRGCPYMCQYCLSSIERGVRFLSMERVKSDLMFFIRNNVRQVKLVDRTFNCKKAYALDIWKFLIENDNGVTNFHFEIAADILDDECIEVLSRARKRLFQLEIGVQTTNKEVLEIIKRKTDIKRLFENTAKIKSFGSIHQHLDLIVGLPREDYSSFGNSFNDVYALKPQQLQIGFLKLLKGSGLRADAEKYGIKYRNYSPYEVLSTRELTYDEISRLKGIEDAVETYYNSGLAVYTLIFAERFFDSAFKMYESFADYIHKNGFDRVSHKKSDTYMMLFDFLKPYCGDSRLENIIKADMFLNDNIKSLPKGIKSEFIEKEKYIPFFENKDNAEKYMKGLEGFTPKQLSNMCRLEYFDYDVYSFMRGESDAIEEKGVYILFNYNQENDLWGNAEFYKVQI